MGVLSCYKLLSRFMFFLICDNMKLYMCTVNLKYYLSVC